MEWTKQKYNEQYEVWWPWIEDNFLKYFTKDNKASHVTKGIFPIYSLSLLNVMIADVLSPSNHRTTQQDQSHRH